MNPTLYQRRLLRRLMLHGGCIMSYAHSYLLETGEKTRGTYRLSPMNWETGQSFIHNHWVSERRYNSGSGIFELTEDGKLAAGIHDARLK